MDIRKEVDADGAQVVINPKLAGLVKVKGIAGPCIREGIAAPVSKKHPCQNLSCGCAVRNRFARAQVDFYVIRGESVLSNGRRQRNLRIDAQSVKMIYPGDSLHQR
jgi:hypothetical protein